MFQCRPVYPTLVRIGEQGGGACVGFSAPRRFCCVTYHTAVIFERFYSRRKMCLLLSMVITAVAAKLVRTAKLAGTKRRGENAFYFIIFMFLLFIPFFTPPAPRPRPLLFSKLLACFQNLTAFATLLYLSHLDASRSESMRYVSSQASTTSLGVATAEQPSCSATKADRLPSDRFQTTTLAPAFARLDAIPWPMMPAIEIAAAVVAWEGCFESLSPSYEAKERSSAEIRLDLGLPPQACVRSCIAHMTAMGGRLQILLGMGDTAVASNNSRAEARGTHLAVLVGGHTSPALPCDGHLACWDKKGNMANKDSQVAQLGSLVEFRNNKPTQSDESDSFRHGTSGVCAALSKAL